MTPRSAVPGFVKPGFEPVQETFAENFERRHELGAGCCIYHRGEKIADLWGRCPRQNALRNAMYRSIGKTNPFLLQEEGGPPA